jgi:hypothetical protein
VIPLSNSKKFSREMSRWATFCIGRGRHVNRACCVTPACFAGKYWDLRMNLGDGVHLGATLVR